ncbi:MAG: PEP-utilizing enzyme [Candidatus Woesearchaeota archaeon]
MIDPKKELFRWGPIDGRVIYTDYWVRSVIAYKKFYGISIPDMLVYNYNDLVIMILDYTKLRNNGEILFDNFLNDDKKVKKEYESWLKEAKKVKEFEKNVNDGVLSKAAEKELIQLFKEWNKLNFNFWIKGFLPEFANWGGEQKLKRELSSLPNLTHEQFVEAFEKLSAPEDLSFFQVEELELMKIRLIESEPEKEKALKKHQRKYYWLRNSYGFTKILDFGFFKDEMNQFSKEETKEKINEIDRYSKKIKDNKKGIIKKYSIPQNIINAGNLVSYLVWWQDYRKSFIFVMNHIVSCFMKEISKRKNIPFREMCHYMHPEVLELLEKNKKIDARKRYDGFVEYFDEAKGPNDLVIMTGKEANDFVRPYIDIKLEKDVKEFSGLVVSRGKSALCMKPNDTTKTDKSNVTKGTVKIILTPRKMDHMNKGDILVAPMTSPDFIVAMRKASAIITDEGCMTCHAAIVSRELGIPCIVAVKIATKVLKDGDVVEVDVQKGVVRKIN